MTRKIEYSVRKSREVKTLDKLSKDCIEKIHQGKVLPFRFNQSRPKPTNLFFFFFPFDFVSVTSFGLYRPSLDLNDERSPYYDNVRNKELNPNY